MPPERIEPSTSSLPMMCSTTEPWRRNRNNKLTQLTLLSKKIIKKMKKNLDTKTKNSKTKVITNFDKLSSALKKNLERRKATKKTNS